MPKQIKTQKKNMQTPAQSGMKILPRARAIKLNDYKVTETQILSVLKTKQIIASSNQMKDMDPHIQHLSHFGHLSMANTQRGKKCDCLYQAGTVGTCL